MEGCSDGGSLEGKFPASPDLMSCADKIKSEVVSEDQGSIFIYRMSLESGRYKALIKNVLV